MKANLKGMPWRLVIAGCVGMFAATATGSTRAPFLSDMVVFALFNALARPSLLAALAEVPAEVRGFVMGLNSSVASVDWLTAALIGGWLFSVVGFAGFAPLTATMCLFAAVIVVPDSRLRPQT